MVHVIEEANRCLQCKKPMCVEGCPISTPIPTMIKYLKDGDIKQGGKMVFENNPLSIVCSLVCDHQAQCEGHCILARKGQAAHISSIENYISDACLDQMEIACAPKNGHMIAVIGAGPAGITIAIEMTKMGYDVTIFDAKDKIGGVMQYGIPAFRLPKSILERYRKKLLSIGVKIRPNTTIGGALEIKDLLRDGYKAIFIGTGVWRPKKLGVVGESLGNVHFAIDFLANPSSYELGETIAIIGAGNTAMDVARTILRSGSHRVTIYARRLTSDVSNEEREYALLDGANMEYGYSVDRITDDGPVFHKNIFDDEGHIIGKDNEEIHVHADQTFIAVSQGPKSKLVDTTEGLKASPSGLLMTDERGQTTYPGIFAAGDVVLGAKTVVHATCYAKHVAKCMDEYVRTLGEDDSDHGSDGTNTRFRIG